MLSRIKKGKTFEAMAEDGSFSLKVSDYVPYIGAAIHAGHRFREELKSECLLTEQDRWYEEDPATEQFIAALPIVIEGHDSRFEYDLNRSPEEAIHEVAWGKMVWTKPLSKRQKIASLLKHHNFYKVVDALVEAVEQRFGGCVVYDIHSYNYKRWDREVPVFNIGTEQVDTDRYRKLIDHWKQSLDPKRLPNLEGAEFAENDVFFGRGYFLSHITKGFQNTLVLATEVKKIYCDEETGEVFPQVVDGLRESFKRAVIANASYFVRHFLGQKSLEGFHLLSSRLDPAVLRVDRELFHLAKDFEVLGFVNPVNVETEKKRFFQSNFKNNPVFRYKHLNVDPFQFKRALFRLPVEGIRDIGMQRLYKDVINAYADKADLLATLGTEKFLYNSLRYFGEPTETEVANARFLLYLNDDMPKGAPDVMVGDEEVKAMFEESARQYGFSCRVEVAPRQVAKALVLNAKKLVKIKKGAEFTMTEARGLVHHEIGVHMVTTINARQQPLKIFRLGMPIYTMTQEGLAVLAEYLSGSLNVKRLRELALRVMAIRLMLDGYDFPKVFAYLMEEGGLDQEEAFYFTTRIFRGGGFTKDFLYLKGFHDILSYYRKGNPLDNLLIGKISLSHLDIVDEMVSRGLILPPSYKTMAFRTPENSASLLSYLVGGIK